MVNFDSEGVAVWDGISSLFVASRASCFTTFDSKGTVVASFPPSRLEPRQWKLRLSDRCYLLRFSKDLPEGSVIDKLLQLTEPDDLWYKHIASAAYSDLAAIAALLQFADLGASESDVRRLLATPAARPENIRRSRSFASLLQRLCGQNVVYAEDSSDENDFWSTILVEETTSSDPAFLIEFQESSFDFEDVAAAHYEQVDYADCARIAELLRRVSCSVGLSDVRSILT